MRKNAIVCETKGFGAKTKGATAYFIGDSGMDYAYKTNQEQRGKQRKSPINFLAWNSEKVDFMEISGKEPFHIYGVKWQERPGDGKFRSKYENINIKQGLQQAFHMDVSSLLLGGYEQDAPLYNKCARIRNFFGDGFCKGRN